ncbi:MAG: GIY-YIG nuclease family protein [Ktedonobacterales bacterium]
MTTRREISKEYKERKLRGGVYTITNTVNGKYIIGHAANLASVRNRFEFAVTTGSTVDPRVQTDWRAMGARVFTLNILEELEQRPDQSQAQFMDDLKVLEQLSRAQLDASKEY